MPKPMTSEEYLKAAGLRCPSCKTSEEVVVLEPLDFSLLGAGRRSQGVFCGLCGACWKDVYTFSGYTDLEPGDAREEQLPEITEEQIRRAEEEYGSVNELPT